MKKYLWDVIHSIEQIESYLSDIPDLNTYINNALIQDAVERRLIIIGEATYRLNQMGIILTHTDSVINRRNTITHQYDDFSERSIWRHVVDDLPDIKEEAKQLLEQQEEN